MNDRGLISLFDEQFALLQEIQGKLSSILNQNGEVQLEHREIKKIERELKHLNWNGLLVKFTGFQYFFKSMPQQQMYFFPRLLYHHLTTLQQKIAGNLTAIRSVNAGALEKSYFRNPEELLIDLTAKAQTLLNDIREKYNDGGFDAVKWGNYRLGNADQNLHPIFGTPSFIWASIMDKLQPKFVMFRRFEPELQIFAEFSLLQDLLTSNPTENVPQEGLLEVLVHALEIQADPQNNQTLRWLIWELFFYCYRREYIIFAFEGPQASAKDKKKSMKIIENQFSEITTTYLLHLLKKASIDLSLPARESYILKDVQHQFGIYLGNAQEHFTNAHDGDLTATNRDLQQIGNTFFRILETIEHWLTNKKDIFNKINKAFKPIQSQIGQIRGDIAQILEDFEAYAASVRENREKLKLEKIVQDNIVELESLLRNYQLKTTPFIESSMPDLDKIIATINAYKEEFLQLHEKISKTFLEFKENGVSAPQLVDNWQNKYEEITNRASFTLRTTLTSIFNKYSTVLKSEQEFFESVTNIAQNPGISSYSTIDFLQPEKMSEHDLRDRISKLDSKLREIDNIKEKIQIEKDEYLHYLENLLKSSGLESKKCIICHKNVDVAQDHFIKCEFCGSMSHYSCAVWWLSRYNSCPVCHNTYNIPHNEMYDPSQINEE